jgi:phosphoribosylcarboxyaminoimidazole (NCAIR) mutase
VILMFSPVKLLPASQFTGDALDSIIQKISGASFAKTAAEKAAEEAAAYAASQVTEDADY